MSTLKRTSDSPPLLLAIVVVLGIAAMAAFAGLLAASASPLRVALGVGAILGGLLLLAPKANLWLAVTVGLTTGALLSHLGAGATKLQWGIVLLSLMLFVPILLQMLPRPRLPAFMWLYLLFIAISIITTLIHWNGLSPMVAGMKRYYQALGIMLALTVLHITWQDNRRIQKTFFWIALLQLPFVLYEFFVLVPIRVAMSSATEFRSDVTDVIAGTFGANLGGGSPGAEMVAFVLILVAFAWAKWREGLITNKQLTLFVLAMLPCITLGEVKFVALLFPLLVLVLYKNDIVANPGRFLPIVIGGGILTMALGYLYFGVFSGGSVEKGVGDMLRYNVEDQGYGTLILNRSTAVTFWWERQGMHDPVGFFFGNGLGSSYWTPDPSVPSGVIGAKFPHYGVGLTALTTLLWDVGLIGTLLYLGVFVAAFVQAGRLYRKETDAAIRSNLLGIRTGIAVFVTFIPYKDSLLTILPFQIVVAVVLGYLGRMLIAPDAFRTQPPSTPTSASR